MDAIERQRRNASGLTETSPHYLGLHSRHATGRHWSMDHQAETLELIEAFTEGETNYTTLAERFKTTRKIVAGIIAINFTKEEKDAAIAIKSQNVSLALLGKIEDLLPEVGLREFAALGMNFKTVFEVGRAAAGEASSFTEPAKPKRTLEQFLKVQQGLTLPVTVIENQAP